MKRVSLWSRTRSFSSAGAPAIAVCALGLGCVNVSVGDTATAGESGSQGTESASASASASEGTSSSMTASATATMGESATATDTDTGTDTATATGTNTDTATTETDGTTETSTTGREAKVVGLSPDKLLTDDGPGQRVEALAVSPDGTKLVAALGGRRVVLFTLADGSSSVVHTIGDGDLFEAGAAVWGPHGFAVGTYSACLLFGEGGSLEHELADRCAYLALTDDGETLVRTTPTSVVAVDAATGESGKVASLSSSAGLGLGGSTVYVLDLTDADYVLRSLTLPELSAAQTYPQDVRQLFGGALRGTLFYSEAKVWTDFAGTPVSLETGGLEDQKRLTFSDDGRWTASLGFSGGVHIFDSASGAHVAEAAVVASSSNGLAFDGAVERLFAGGDEGVQVFTILKE